MRFVRAIAGTVLLTVGLPVLLVAGPLGAVAPHTGVRLGWLDPPGWCLVVVGAALVALGVAILAWPTRQRPREVVFVVEPSQVPVLAARIGVSSLAELGRTAPAELGRTAPAGPLPVGRVRRVVVEPDRRPGIVIPLPVPAVTGPAARAVTRAPVPAVTRAPVPAVTRAPVPARWARATGQAGGPPCCRHGGPPSPGDRCTKGRLGRVGSRLAGNGMD